MLKQLFGALAFGLPAAAIAGGPLVLEGPNGRTPATYQDPAIVLNFDNADLNATTPKVVADAIVNEALQIWNVITTSTISLSQGADTPVDIDADNFTDYIPVPGSSTIHNDEDGLNPIVYDDNGGIIDAYFGVGQGTGDEATVVGFSASSIIIGSSFFTEGFAVVNGNENLGITRTQLKLIIAHELGHFIGLDHSQADINNTEELQDSGPTRPNSCTTSPADDYPLMYPYACRDNMGTHPDDDVAVSTLYPTADFLPNQGQLKGTFVTSSGAAVNGANLWVENTQTGQVYSIVSDYLTQCTGFFALMLPEGKYLLHANSINVEFYGGSSVGPHANSPTDLSFQSPASDIGADLVFKADGNLPAEINVVAGESVDIVFRTDGSGSVTSSDTQVALTEFYSTESVACPSSGGGGGGGSPGAPLLAALLLVPALRKRTTTQD